MNRKAFDSFVNQRVFSMDSSCMFLIEWPHNACNRSCVFIWIENRLTVSSISVYFFAAKVSWNLVNTCHFNLPHRMHYYVQKYSQRSLACWPIKVISDYEKSGKTQIQQTIKRKAEYMTIQRVWSRNYVAYWMYEK